MKPDTNPNDHEPSTEHLYDHHRSNDCNGYWENSPENTSESCSNTFNELGDEAKHIEEFVQEFVHSTVAQAHLTLGHLLCGSSGMDLTEDSSLSLISTTDSISEDMGEPHCEQQSTVELYVLQLLDDIVDEALDRVKELQRSSVENENSSSEQHWDNLLEEFSDQLLIKVFNEAKKDAFSSECETVPPDTNVCTEKNNVQPRKNTLRVDCSKKIIALPRDEVVADLFSVQRNDFENTMVLEQSGFLERLVSSILSSAITNSSELRQDGNYSERESTLTTDRLEETLMAQAIPEETSSSITCPTHISISNLNERDNQLPMDYQTSSDIEKTCLPNTRQETMRNNDLVPPSADETQGFPNANALLSEQEAGHDESNPNAIEIPNNSLLMDVNLSDEVEERYMLDPSNNWINHTEALIRETELELSRIQIKVLKTDHSIYKLAYDEVSTADHSEAEDSEPCSVPNITDRYVRDRSEIIVHELDTGSEAGSEDVELIPHRYDSSAALEKHLYVNKLSLATELLRTKERIPYDDEFKMIVQEGQKTEATTDGRVNEGFEGDSEVVAGSNRKSNVSTVDSGVQSDESGDEGAVEAQETNAFAKETNAETEEVENGTNSSTNGGYRRLGARTFGVLKGSPFPCWCCNVM